MTYRVEISSTARSDADEYFSYIRDVMLAPDAAVRWYEDLILVLKSLAEMPARFSVIAEAEELGFPYRSLNFHSHRVIFAVHEDEHRVMVHRIYHGAMKTLGQGDL